ncbi:MAG: efflux RND transporter periplasmic adaptor subunit [Thermoanaerobaculia bacterium]
MRSTLLFLLMTAMAGLLAACGGGEPVAAQAQTSTELPEDVRNVGALTRPVEPGTIDGTILEPEAVVTDGFLTANGEFVSPSRSSVAPKIPGRVERVFVDEGARVQRGQPLLTLETDYFRLDVERARAELDRATAMRAEAERELSRKQELRQKDSVPQAVFDRAKAAFDQAVAAQSAANTGLRIANQRLADAVIRSPLTGVVAEKRTEAGEFLGDGGVAFVVIQTAPLKLRFMVPEKYLAQIRPGQSVAAKVDPYPGETFTGTIRTVGGVIDPQTRTMFAEAEFANEDGRLRPGLFARVEAALQ